MLVNRCTNISKNTLSRGITTGYNEAFIIEREDTGCTYCRTLIIIRDFKAISDDERYQTLASEATRQMVDFYSSRK